MARILSVGPHPEILAARNRALARAGHEVRGAATRADALRLARSGMFEVVLLCSEFPPGYAAELADEFKALIPGAPVVMFGDPAAPFTTADIAEMLDRQSPPKAA